MEPIKKETPKVEKIVETSTPVIPLAEETITIKKDTLDELMARLERVEKAADKSRLAKYDELNKDKKGKLIRLRTVDGKVVLSWSNMLTNLVEKDSNGKWREDQTIELFYEDKTSEKMDLVVFNRHFVHIPADVISETKLTGDEGVILKVKTEDGREYEINNKFIN